MEQAGHVCYALRRAACLVRMEEQFELQMHWALSNQLELAEKNRAGAEVKAEIAEARVTRETRLEADHLARCRGCGEMIPLDQAPVGRNVRAVEGALIEQHRQQCCARRGLESIAPQVSMINIEVQPLEKEGSWPRGGLDEMPIFFKRGFGKVSRILCYGDESVAGRCLSGGADGAPDEFEPPGRRAAREAAGVSCEVAVCGLSGLGPAALVSSIGAASISGSSGHVGRGLIPVLEQGEPYDLVVISVSPRAISQPATIYTELCRLHQACHARKTPTVVLVPPSGLIIPGGPETSRSAATPVQTRQRLSAQTLNNLLARWVKATPQAVAFHDMSKFGCEGGEQSVPCSGGQLWSGGGRSLTPVGFRALGQQLATAILPHLGPGVQSDQKSIAAMSSGGLSQSQRMAVSRSPSQGSAFSVSRTPPRFVFGPRQKDVGSPREANTEKACKELEGKHDTMVEGFAERMKTLSALLQARDQEVSETVASFDELKEAYRKCEADAESVLQKVADHGSSAAQRESAYQELEMRHHAEVGEAARLNKALTELRQECGQDLQERAAQQDALRKAYHNCEAALSQALADHAESVEQQQELQLKCTAATTQTDKCLAACQHLERNCAEAVKEVQDSHRKSEKDAEAALSHATAHHASEIERHEAAYQQLHRRHAAAAEEVTEYLAKVKRMDELDVQVGELRQACSKYESDAAAALSQTMAVHSSELAQCEEASQVARRPTRCFREGTRMRWRRRMTARRRWQSWSGPGSWTHGSVRRVSSRCENYPAKEADAVNTLSGNLQELHEKRMADAEEAALQEEAHRQLHMEHAAAVEEARECERAIAQLRSARDVDAQEAAEAKRELEQAVAQVERARDHAVEEGARRLGELEESHRRSLEAAAAALARAVEEHGADAAQRRAACQELERRHAEAAEEAGRRGEACSELGRALEAARREGAAALLEAQGAHRRSEDRPPRLRWRKPLRSTAPRWSGEKRLKQCTRSFRGGTRPRPRRRRSTKRLTGTCRTGTLA
ncbi:unnamed protein product [Prorocentrum cordatum]|uniref:Uncharacterized protein n=1 Tax=Prorocentrum cordatum TaxID=2364126 RepID=A0ABN9S0M4_9DINO|nr:unnamed protein product [Polarella glacialis]